MSSEGEFFVGEVEDAVRKKINKKIGDDWRLDIPKSMYGIWDRRYIPDNGKVPIIKTKTEGTTYDDVGTVGEVIWEAKKFTDFNDFGDPFINAEVKTAKIKWFKSAKKLGKVL